MRKQEPRGRQKTRPEDFQKGLLLDIQVKYIKSLKIFFKYAEERGYNRYTKYKDFQSVTKADQKRKKSDHEIVTLTLSELKQFYTHDFSDNPHLERVRDLFCFGCFTGQRWGDFSNFDKSQLQDDVWTFISDRTKRETQIDLTGYVAPALDILKKYNYQLPKITPQKLNDYLKDAAEEAGINEPTKIIRYVGVNEIIIIKPKSQFLSSHSARRTCVSILLNDFNLSVVHAMGITGHTDIKTLQKYINKDREARGEAIGKTKAVNEVMLTVAV
jgi:integrase